MTAKIIFVALAILSIFGSANVAAGPFEQSDNICRSFTSLKCAWHETQGNLKSTVRDFTDIYQVSYLTLLKLNKWDKKTVTLDTIVPPFKKVAIGLN